MNRSSWVWWLALGAVQPLFAQTVDELRIDQMRQDIQRLERLVQAQERRIAELERELARLGGMPAADRSARSGRVLRTASDAWLLPAQWDRVRVGMPELEVVAILGVPTAVRTQGEGGGKQLLYSLEVGDSGILTGAVNVSDGRVSEVRRPELRALQ